MLNRSIKDALAAEEKFFRGRPVCVLESFYSCMLLYNISNNLLIRCGHAGI